jgi:general secretion pathway protein B
MSFILDALKKSESDRQRQGGPALFEVKVARPRHALPPWAISIAVLLAANIAIVALFLGVHRSTPGTMRAPAHAPGEPARPAVVAMSTPAAASPAEAPAPRSVVTAAPPAAPPAAPAAAPAPAPAAQSPAAAQSAAAEEAPAAASSNPDDFAPAAEPPVSGGLGRVKRATDAGVPLYQQLAATPGSRVPQLRLDLHAYAERAEDRWVLVNMHRLREGDSLEGVHVDRITPDGAVLSYQGSQFLLTRE